MSFSEIVNFHPASQRFHFDDFPCGSLSVFLNPQVSNTAGGYIHSRPCQENLPKSLKHNTLNKSRHRKERAQSLFMAELQLLSSKQQILLNLYQVSDEQQREKERAKQFFFLLCAKRHKHQPCERVAAWRFAQKNDKVESSIFLNQLAKKICFRLAFCVWFLLQII